MRIDVLILALACALGLYGCSRTNATPTELSKRSNSPLILPAADSRSKPVNTAKVDFATQVRPILDAKCQPCHFNGGKVYAQMPFDRPETIKRLGTKLFTRIKEENERQVISAFLAQE
jgi:hypothetical protein